MGENNQHHDMKQQEKENQANIKTQNIHLKKILIKKTKTTTKLYFKAVVVVATSTIQG